MNPNLVGDILQDLNEHDSFQEIFDSVYRRMVREVPCHRLGVALYDATRGVLTLHAARSDRPLLLREGYSAELRGSSLEPLLHNGEPRIINDLEAYHAARPASDSTRLILREGLRSSLSLPLISRGRPIGVLFFSSREKNAFTPAHAELCRLVAGHVSVALERSLMAEELRASKEYLENILDNSADAIVAVDEHDVIRRWSRGAEAIFGYAAADAVGKSLGLLVPEDLKHRLELEKIGEMVRRKGFVTDYETERVGKDGSRIRVNLTSTAIRDREGRIVGRSAVMRDVTHLKRLQEELVRNQSLATVGEMAATVAHEVRNPLAGISGALQVIKDAIPETDYRRAIVPEVLAQVRRLDETVRDLLVFARPLAPEVREIDLVNVIDDVSSNLRHLNIQRHAPASLPMRGDPRLFQEVLFNLIQNAADAMPPGGLVRVTAHRQNGNAMVTVADNGCGMSPEVRARVFSPFFTTKTRGTGLGLAISRKIIEASGGRIEIDSTQGKGTKVTVLLPVSGSQERTGDLGE